ncbi:GGDEF domain-containing protein [Paraburkholderia adhaesiva]|uniref:GGDEF domain-containing protein n=1 Tax=Paraburkholderia adhaesiva TaxID=2883244 RepID=UPI001F24E8B3|nr:diguanylate cyclase [Paraburkholderia adhaesiva]
MTEPNTLSKRLRKLIDTVQHNERTLQRFQQIEVRLISVDDFAALLDTLVTDLARAFDLSVVTLWLDARVPYIGELLHGDSGPVADSRNLRGGHADERGLVLPGEPGAAWLGQPTDLPPALRAEFFDPVDEPRSAAILPIESGAGVCAYLCLGSADATRFTADMATDLLQRFAVFVSAGLVNVVHRQRLRRQGVTDALTALPNRRYFDARLREEIQRAARVAGPVACLVIDIDLFRQFNDTFGHDAGDRALMAVGSCIRRTVRQGETVARYGGEEFVALVQGDTRRACIAAERVRAAVEALVIHDDRGAPLHLTVSIGVAARAIKQISTDTSDTANALIEEADRAMQLAKSSGRNRVEAHQADAGAAA